MTLEELLASMHHLDQLLHNRVQVVRRIVDEEGNEIGRFYRGSYLDTPRDPEDV